MQETLEQRTASRCANELGKSILYMRALSGLCQADGFFSVDFVRLAEWAFFNEIFNHAILALDKREQAGFWCLYKSRRAEVELVLTANGLSLHSIEVILPKLKLIRDKTHFHLDRNGVLAPNEIWAEAAITFDQLQSALDVAFLVTCHLHKIIRGNEFLLPDYDGLDAKRVAEAAYQQKLLQGQWRDPNLPQSIWD